MDFDVNKLKIRLYAKEDRYNYKKSLEVFLYYDDEEISRGAIKDLDCFLNK